MSGEKSIKKNYVFNVLAQIVNIALPLITVPYISRVLGPKGVGINSYTSAIVQYFALIGCLGLTTYGNRQIAYVRDDKEKMSSTFWSLVLLRICTLGIALILYLIIFGTNKTYGNVYLIQTVAIIAVMFDISWLFMGNEDFKSLFTRGLLVKILCLTGIFVFVKDENDLWKYILLNNGIILLGNLVMWIYVPKMVCKVKRSQIDIKPHILPAAKLFIPTIATQLAQLIDKTMLGAISTEVQTGYYEQSLKITGFTISLVTALGTVMLPRMSNAFANGRKEEMNKYFNTSLKAVSLIAIPMSFGIAGIANEFVPWFFGAKFNGVKILLVILSVQMFFIAINNVLGMQYLVPRNKNRQYTMAILMGALTNCLINIVLINKLNAMGACIATVIAEIIITIAELRIIKSDIAVKEYLKSFIKYIVAAIFMYAIVRIIGYFMGAGIVTTITQGIVGIVIYEVMLIILGDELNSSILKVILRRK